MKWIITCLFSLSFFNFIGAQEKTGHLQMEEQTYKSASGTLVKGQSGQLWVPENRNNPQSAAIPIAFVRLKSTNPNPQTPLIYLDGGPGSSCTWQASQADYLDYWLQFLAVGDVILLDQRGTGQGTERVLHIWQHEIPEAVFVDRTIAKQHLQSIAQEALPALQARGVDLNGYTTKQNAEDMDALRAKLGIEQWNIFGFSYGTHLGQAYLRYFGDRVTNAILVGVEGPNHTYKLPLTMDHQFQKIALMASQDPGLKELVPDLVALYQKVVKKLKKHPIELKVNSPLSGQPIPIKVGPFGLQMIMRFDLGDASDIPVFPRLLYSIDRGDYSILQWFVQKRISAVFGIQGMSATMDLASGISADRRQRIQAEEQQSLFPGIVNITLDTYDEMDGFWPDPDLGEEFRAPLISSVRTLFMSGTLDFNTPPFQAEEVRWGFANSSHIIVTNAGHEQILTHPQAIDRIVDFLNGKSVNEVALSHPPLKFIPLEGKASPVWHPALGERK